jgi:hypothetical protein
MKYIYQSLFIIISLTTASMVQAQWNPPNTPAPSSNVPQLINVGNNEQVKSGPSAALVIRKNPLWAPSVAGAFSLLMDQSLVSTASATPTAPAKNYALVSTAPVSVNGIFSNNDIIAKTSITAKKIYDHSLIQLASLFTKSPVCATTSAGALENCIPGVAGTVNPAPVVSLNISPKQIPINVPTTVSIDWSSTSAKKCAIASDNGINTAGAASSALTATSGSFSTHPILLTNANDTAVFTLICTNEDGLSKMTSTQVYTTAAVITTIEAPTVVLSFGDVNTNRSVDKIAYDAQGSTVWNFTLNAKISGAAASSCRTWTEKRNLVNPLDLPQWPGTPTNAYSVPANARTFSTSVTIGSVYGVAKFGSRNFYLSCSNVGGTSTDSVMIDHR